MTSTSVKDVGTVLQSVRANAGATVRTAKDGGFQAVFGRQTSQSKSGGTTGTASSKTEKKSQNAAKPTEISANKNVEKAEKSMEPEKELEEVDEEAVKKAMEVLQTAAAELITQIAETFGFSEEEMSQLMDAMELQPLDLLQSENLSRFLLAAGGAEDSTALLTNEELYGNFQTIMNAQNDIFATSAETLQTDEGQLRQLITEMASGMAEAASAEGLQEAKEQAPIIEMSISDEPVVKQQEQDVKASGQDMAENAAQDAELKTFGNGRKNAGESGHSRNSAGSHHQSGNILLQQIKEDDFNMQPMQVSDNSFAGDMETQDIMRQIMDYMKVQIKPDMSSLEMQLHPASLGTLQVQVASKGGVLTAQFITQNEAVKAALESQMVKLQDSFAEQGVKVEAIEVTVQTHQFEQNLEQGRERNQEAPERRGRGRRIRLDSSVAAEGMEELNEEERLASQMMSASGSTVDYTA